MDEIWIKFVYGCMLGLIWYVGFKIYHKIKGDDE